MNKLNSNQHSKKESSNSKNSSEPVVQSLIKNPELAKNWEIRSQINFTQEGGLEGQAVGGSDVKSEVEKGKSSQQSKGSQRNLTMAQNEVKVPASQDEPQAYHSRPKLSYEQKRSNQSQFLQPNGSKARHNRYSHHPIIENRQDKWYSVTSVDESGYQLKTLHSQQFSNQPSPEGKDRSLEERRALELEEMKQSQIPAISENIEDDEEDANHILNEDEREELITDRGSKINHLELKVKQESANPSVNNSVIINAGANNMDNDYIYRLALQNSPSPNRILGESQFQQQEHSFQDNLDESQSDDLDIKNVFNRLYINAKDLLIKKEVKKEISNYLSLMRAKELATPKINQNFVFSKGHRSSSKNGEARYCRNAQDCLYADYRRRQEKSLQQIQNENVTANSHMNMVKSNNNAHALALQKIEKDLIKILSMVRQTDLSMTNLTNISNPNNLARVGNSQAQSQVYLGRSQIREFFEKIHMFKALHESTQDSEGEKGGERALKEMRFLEQLWRILYMKKHKEKEEKIEIEIVMQLFKILFDPYTPLEQQVTLIEELRKLIVSIYAMGQIEIQDRLKMMNVASEVMEEKVQVIDFLTKFISEFRQLYINFNNVSYLTRVIFEIERQDNFVKLKLRTNDDENCTFQPRINKKSERMDMLSRKENIYQESPIVEHFKKSSSQVEIFRNTNPVPISQRILTANCSTAKNQEVVLDYQEEVCHSEVYDDDDENESGGISKRGPRSINQSVANHSLAVAGSSAVKDSLKYSQSNINMSFKDQKQPSNPAQNIIVKQGGSPSSRKKQMMVVGKTALSVETWDQRFPSSPYENQEQLKKRSMNSQSQRHLQLFKKSRERDEKVRQRSEEQDKKNMEQCTFQPRINRSSKRMIGNPEQDAYNDNSRIFSRLYNQKEVLDGRNKQMLKIQFVNKEQKIKEECTFQPQIMQLLDVNIYRNYSKAKTPVSAQPKGFEENIKRMREAYQYKINEQDEFEKQIYPTLQLSSLGKAKSYTGQITEQQPFQFKTTERSRERQNKKEPLIMVELMIAPGKTATISIYKGDNPYILARNFSKTYNLNKKAQEALVSILSRHIKEENDKIERSLSLQEQLDIIYSQEAERNNNKGSGTLGTMVIEGSLISVKEENEGEQEEESQSLKARKVQNIGQDKQEDLFKLEKTSQIENKQSSNNEL